MKKLFYTIDVVYKPISKITQTIDYYFSNSMRNAYRRNFSKGKRGVENPIAEQCYGCNKFFVEKKNLKNIWRFEAQCPMYSTSLTIKTII